jgi:predicted  nucleic acid-binding Zn-ribbon protein
LAKNNTTNTSPLQATKEEIKKNRASGVSVGVNNSDLQREVVVLSTRLSALEERLNRLVVDVNNFVKKA